MKNENRNIEVKEFVMSKTVKTISSSIFFILLCVFACVCLPLGTAFRKDSFVSTLFLTIGFMSAIGMITSSSSRSFSIRFIFYFYCFAFLFCAGITQFATGKFCWAFTPSIQEVERANIYVIVFMFIFAISKIKISRGLSIQKPQRFFSFGKVTFKIVPFLFIELLLLLLGTSAFIRGGGIAMFFSRELFSKNSFVAFIDNKAFGQIVDAVITAGCIFCTILSLNLLKQKSRYSMILVILSIVTMLINIPPLAVARFSMVSAYGSIFLYFSSWIKKGKRFAYILSFGLLVVFPALNAFRYDGGEITIEVIQKSIGEITSNFTNADYDSYTMLVYSLRYVETYGVTYGRQLVGVLLFFIPRSLWAGKPGGSGSMIIESLAPSYINPNVSCSIIGEGILNFGFLGILLFAFILGKISTKLDDYYWNKTINKDCCFKNIYSYMVFFALFMFRGDLMSTTAFLVGMIVSTIAFSCLFKDKKQNKSTVTNC